MSYNCRASRAQSRRKEIVRNTVESVDRRLRDYRRSPVVDDDFSVCCIVRCGRLLFSTTVRRSRISVERHRVTVRSIVSPERFCVSFHVVDTRILIRQKSHRRPACSAVHTEVPGYALYVSVTMKNSMSVLRSCCLMTNDAESAYRTRLRRRSISIVAPLSRAISMSIRYLCRFLFVVSRFLRKTS